MPPVSKLVPVAVAVFMVAFTFAGAELVEDTKVAGSVSKPSPGEYESLGKQLADDFNAGNLDAFFGRMDRAGFLNLIFEGFEIPERERQEFEREFAKTVVLKLTEKIQQFKQAKFLRLQEVDGRPRVLLRLTASDFAITYLAFYVGKNEAGKIGWVDAFGYTTAETIGDGLRRYLLFVSKGRLTTPRNLAEAALCSNGRQFVQKTIRVQKLFENGQYEAAVRASEQLPDELRTAKFLLGLRLEAAQKLGEDVYLKAIEAWEEAHPGDPSLNLIAVDGHILRKSYGEAVRCLDTLTNQLKGADGRLCFIKAYVLDKDRMMVAARHAAEEGVKVEPDMPENYTALLKFALEAGEFKEAVDVLEAVEKNLPDTDPKRLIPETDKSEEFMKSAEFQAWFKKRLG